MTIGGITRTNIVALGCSALKRGLAGAVPEATNSDKFPKDGSIAQIGFTAATEESQLYTRKVQAVLTPRDITELNLLRIQNSDEYTRICGNLGRLAPTHKEVYAQLQHKKISVIEILKMKSPDFNAYERSLKDPHKQPSDAVSSLKRSLSRQDCTIPPEIRDKMSTHLQKLQEEQFQPIYNSHITPAVKNVIDTCSGEEIICERLETIFVLASYFINLETKDGDDTEFTSLINAENFFKKLEDIYEDKKLLISYRVFNF